MYVMIVGCGKVGARLANLLSDDGHDVAIIDEDRRSFRHLGDDFHGLKVTGVPIDKDILRSAGIENADAFAAVTPDDNTNIMACQIAQEIYKVPRVIARIYNPEREQVFQDFGLRTLCPTNLTVENIKSLLMGEDRPKNILLGRDCINIFQMAATPSMVGKTLDDIELSPDEFLFGMLQNDKFLFYEPHLVIGETDHLVITRKID